jgi:hypothetical protein
MQNQEFVNPPIAGEISSTYGAGTALSPAVQAVPETGLTGTWRWLGSQWFYPTNINANAAGVVTITGPAVKIG